MAGRIGARLVDAGETGEALEVAAGREDDPRPAAARVRQHAFGGRPEGSGGLRPRRRGVGVRRSLGDEEEGVETPRLAKRGAPSGGGGKRISMEEERVMLQQLRKGCSSLQGVPQLG